MSDNQLIKDGLDQFGMSWRGRTVLVVGLGKSGLSAAQLLLRVGCRVRVTEIDDSESLRMCAGRLRERGIEAIELGGHTASLLEGCQVLVLSPGVCESALPVRWAQDQGIPMLSEVELAFRFCPCPVVAVTGTNGKSTVVTLTHLILQAAGRRAVACGNLGTPFCSVLSQLSFDAIAVVEVSSFQLLCCDQFRPAIGVLLNLGINHIDRHRDPASYVAAKARLFQRQTPRDFAVLNGCDPEVVKLSGQFRAQHVWFGVSCDSMPGLRLDRATCRSLSENAQAAFQIGRLLDVPEPLIYQAIREFPGLPHRLEYVATINGVRFVNDAKSTTPESLLYGLANLPGAVVAIVGGRDKGLDFGSLAAGLSQERIRGVVLIGETRRRIRALLNGSARVQECQTLEEALQEAVSLSEPGGTILFSPACASFDMFRNFEERGLEFKRLVKRLQDGKPLRPADQPAQGLAAAQ